ncbi:DNA glycosylase [Trametes coccinea BRFM310]|uniref:DNA glycosylase n=1 Tax=Trametes coccinea (strain BRFM310) TaxID=1353009 RepID=A0A1Y2IZX3_TRAC3|nr:DNA glycosylase [Trametes coccinea BRFM310]
MAITRSATKSTAAGVDSAANNANEQSVAATTKGKRKAADLPAESAEKKPRTARKTAKTAVAPLDGRKSAQIAAVVPTPLPNPAGEELVPAVLTFSFEEAKRHLISVDPRFEDVFRRVKCRPFEHLERVDPFRGQQISWKAAAAITHKFVRLFDPSIPESLAESKSNFFPSAHQVVTKDVATLRTAGLSARKAEYVLDLAARFADGRLSTRKLLQADDEELHTMLTEVRGIGRWTGDLGVQRGLLRWFISLHSPSHPVSLRKDKLTDQHKDEPVTISSLSPSKVIDSQEDGSNDTMPRAATPDASSVLPIPDAPLAPNSAMKGKGKAGDESLPVAPAMSALPDPFTPSINKTLNMTANLTGEDGEYVPPPLPEGLTVAQMKSRLSGKKIKGALLTPKEMEDLTECWRPYRSLGVYYMWALSEEPK